MLRTVFLILLIVSIYPVKANSAGNQQKPNILLIAVDDLRPELGCYGVSHIHSPNIDKLAAEGVLFSKAFTQQAVCAPSRNTLMTGLRPDKLGIWDLATFFRDKAPDAITLPQQFMKNGYLAEGMGKIYHTGHGNKNDVLSWSPSNFEYPYKAERRPPLNSGDTAKINTCYPEIDNLRLPWYRSPMPEEEHDDYRVASHAIERINALKDKSFFLAVGFVKPHLPFVAPAKYWDMYDPSKIIVPSELRPEGSRDYVFANSGELRKYYKMPEKGFLTNEDAKKMIHGYYACTSFIDAQVGRLINHLKEQGLYENTIIVLWGDHGWKLGEYGEWCKHTNFEVDTRIPLIVRAPGLAGKAKCDALVETVDVYPTLCELAQIETPKGLQGTSFVPFLKNPGKISTDVAFSQYPRTVQEGQTKISVMGYSMRTDKHRYTRWIDRKTQKIRFEEIYEHSLPGLEMHNLALNPGNEELLAQLRKRFDTEYKKEHQ